MSRPVAALVIVASALAGCRSQTTESSGGRAAGGVAVAANVTTGCVERFDPAIDYFPDKANIEDAQNFAVEYHRSYKIVTVRQPFPGGQPERYLLLQCGAPRPALTADLAAAPLVQVPITSMFSSSTTHLPMLEGLGRLESLTGVADVDHVTMPAVLTRIRSGEVVEFEPNSVIDAELVVAKGPSVLMAGGSFSAAFPTIAAAGVPVVANAEWLEPTALARAEWVKYMALYFNEEQKAEARFRAIKDRYNALVARIRAIPDEQRPTVMTGRATSGTFSTAGGRSYAAALIRDAGGRYVWDDNADTGSVPRDLEAELRRSSNADIWINGSGWADLPAMLRDEPRYAAFNAFRRAQVWVYERQTIAAGGSDYWSRAVTRPDLVLADLVKIFHPALLPDHEFEWYMPVPTK